MTMNRTKAYANLIRDERNQTKEDREENQKSPLMWSQIPFTLGRLGAYTPIEVLIYPKQIVEHHVEGITWRLASLTLSGAKSETTCY